MASKRIGRGGRSAGAEPGKPQPQDGPDPKKPASSKQQRERIVDEELDDTFPASDPPSWTLGGSIPSKLRK